MIGLGIDMAVGGVSLGAAAALGALLGGLWQTGKQTEVGEGRPIDVAAVAGSFWVKISHCPFG